MTHPMDANGGPPKAHRNETILIEDIDQFVNLLTVWHTEKVKVLEHMLEIPDGTEMEANGVSVVLTGDMLAGFKTGIILSLMELGILPFVSEPDAVAH